MTKKTNHKNLKNNNLTIKMLFLLINILFTDSLQSQQLKSPFYEGIINKNIATLEIKKTLLDLKKKAILEKDSILLTKTLISISAYERSKINYEQAFINAGEALYISKKLKSDLLIAKSNEEFGVLLYMYKQEKEAEKHLTAAHKIFTSLYKKNKLGIKDLYQSNYNLVLLSQLKKDPIGLEKYVSYCDTILNQNHLSKKYNALLNEKRASVFQWNLNYSKALKLLYNSANTLENLPNQDKVFKNFLFIVYGRIANIHHLSANKFLANKFYNKAVTLKDYTGENTFYQYFIYKKYALLLAELNQYAKAYSYEAKSNALGHTYWNPRNQKNSSFISIKNQFKNNLENQKKELNKKQLEVTTIKNKLLQLKVLMLFVVLILLIIITIVFYRVKSLKHEKIEKDSEKLIQIKNKELTYNTLQLIEKERMLTEFSTFLKENYNNTHSKLFLKRIHKNSSTLWEAFNNRFKEQNIGFYEKLQKKIPHLTSADLKLCALIKLNFSGKEMSYLLGISHGSVNVARHRLRKKLKLSKEINLTEFMNTI
ncbi:DNA-binding CsgD family transcriptional regulator [Wenyingzhuangia aestuarii]|nr:DNA-binding CsgD family transcriptional regulator [Wenyingzhuangia aestuarii]